MRDPRAKGVRAVLTEAATIWPVPVSTAHTKLKRTGGCDSNRLFIFWS